MAPRVRRPASENLQGKKPRLWNVRPCRRRYWDLSATGAGRRRESVFSKFSGRSMDTLAFRDGRASQRTDGSFGGAGFGAKNDSTQRMCRSSPCARVDGNIECRPRDNPSVCRGLARGRSVATENKSNRTTGQAFVVIAADSQGCRNQQQGL